MTDCPPHVRQGGVRMRGVGLQPRGLEEYPGDVRIVHLRARRRLWALKLAPAAVGFLRGNEPIRGPAHWHTILRIPESCAAGKAQQDLAGIERDRHAWDCSDDASLEAALAELNRNEPIEHRVRARAKRIVLPP